MKENARRIIIILCHGESPFARALLVPLPHPSASPFSLSSSLAVNVSPFTPSRPSLHRPGLPLRFSPLRMAEVSVSLSF
jgi:hypothetical protein